MDKAQITSLIRQWQNMALEAGEEERIAKKSRLSDNDLDSVDTALSVALEATHEALVSCDYGSVAGGVDELLASRGLPALDHSSEAYRRLARELLKAKWRCSALSESIGAGSTLLRQTETAVAPHRLRLAHMKNGHRPSRSPKSQHYTSRNIYHHATPCGGRSSQPRGDSRRARKQDCARHGLHPSRAHPALASNSGSCNFTEQCTSTNEGASDELHHCSLQY